MKRMVTGYLADGPNQLTTPVLAKWAAILSGSSARLTLAKRLNKGEKFVECNEICHSGRRPTRYFQVQLAAYNSVYALLDDAGKFLKSKYL
ncbi:hypothetical protein [Halovibrio sp. HP20-50]|uniref:hypothetical protein n=1 Tax=Halovibrio sp. HP20-59 TaxID=3080275 RepID=UPI00294AC551|nr:hypothetical protein [Halovibrio sp. HP20-59]MEA2117901.1 hypothetical protein [Halovibrio sp. HP20-59]